MPSRKELCTKDVEAYEQIVDEALGDPTLITADKAVMLEDGSFFGGINFERTLRTVGDLRSYNLSTAIQIPKQMAAPAADSKVFKLGSDPHLKMRRDLLRVGPLFFLFFLSRSSPVF